MFAVMVLSLSKKSFQPLRCHLLISSGETAAMRIYNIYADQNRETRFRDLDRRSVTIPID
jgi:hypothetical protein